MYGFLVFLVAREFRLAWRAPLIVGATVLVILIAFSRLYLGAHWFSDVAAGLAFGTAWITLLAVAYAHHHPRSVHPHGLLIVVCAALAIGGGINIYVRNESDTERYAIREKVHTVTTASEWLAKNWRDLPAHRIDLGGEFEEPITVQWVGDLSRIKDQLLRAGWRVPVSWTARATATWLRPEPDPLALPVVPILQDGRAPVVALIYPQSKGSRLVLRLWATAVEIGDPTPPKPLWVGAVVEERLHRFLSLVTISTAEPNSNTPREILANSGGDGRLVRRANELPTELWDGQVLLIR
jgi:undecaprenyl-diphosphatase